MSYGNFDNNRNSNNGYTSQRSYGGPERRSQPRYEQNFDRPAPVAPPPPPPVDPKTRDLIQFKDRWHAPMMLQGQAKIGPAVEIDTKDLHDSFLTLVKPSRDLPPNLVDYKDVIFTMYEGKYVVMLGLKTVVEAVKAGQAKIKGRLLSSPALKRCVIE